jgi:hypothetical protein
MNASGIGIIIADRQPSNVPAHCTPRLTNICLEKRGKHAPTADLRMVLAANTDAALFAKLISSCYNIRAKPTSSLAQTYNCRYESIR